VLGATIHDNSIAWWQNNGGDPVQWTKYVLDDNFLKASFVFAADLDNECDSDVLGTAWDGNTIAWWRNDGGDSLQ
jgi:hypothetical protein